MFDRWIHRHALPRVVIKGLPRLFCAYLRVMLNLELYGQGMGRHSDEVVLNIAHQDYKALAQMLGNLLLRNHSLS